MTVGKLAIATLAALTAAATAHAAAPLVSSTFSTDAEGWSVADLSAYTGAVPTVGNTYAVTYSATGGNPGGVISATDQSTFVYYFAAPAKFLGNRAAAAGGTLSFDVSDGPIDIYNSGQSPAILVGATESIYFPDATAVNPNYTSLSLSLAANGGGHVNSQTGPAATAADFALVLGNLQSLYVEGDYYRNGDTAHLDNVAFNAATPEPTTLATLGLAGVTLVSRRRRR